MPRERVAAPAPVRPPFSSSRRNLANARSSLPPLNNTASSTTTTVDPILPSSTEVTLSSLNLRQELWPTFNTNTTTSSWTLDLGLSPPPARLRRSSGQSVVTRQPSQQHPPAVEEPQRQLRRVRSAESSAGGSILSPSDLPQFAWDHDRPRDDQSISPRTFGGRSEDGSSGRGPRSSVKTPSSGRSTADPRSLTEYGSVRDDSFSVETRSVEEDRMMRSSRSNMSLFDESSWEYRVAQALFVAGSGASRSSSNPSLPATPHTPSFAPRSSRKSSPFATTASRPRRTPLPYPPAVTPTLPAVLQLPSRANEEEEPTVKLVVGEGAEADRELDSDSDSDISWHDAASVLELDTTPFEKSLKTYSVPSSDHIALAWDVALSPDSNRLSFRASSLIISAPSRLSAGRTISFNKHHNPFDDSQAAFQSPSQVSLLHNDMDPDPIQLPLPFAPVATTSTTPYLHSESNFLSSPPKELRKVWKEEQRQRRISQRRSSLPPLTANNVNNNEVRIPITTLPSSPTSHAHAHSTSISHPTPALHRRTPSSPSPSPSFHLPFIPTTPLSLIPFGAYLFLLGFIFPPFCWWGAFVPRLSPSSSRSSSAAQGGFEGPLTNWPSGVRRPFGNGGRGKGWRRSLTRFVEGEPSPGDEGMGGVKEEGGGPMEKEGSVWNWRRRNRVMCVFSVVEMGLLVGLGVWAGIAGSSQNGRSGP